MLSSNEAAKKLGLAASTLSRYVASGKIPAPKTVEAGQSIVHAWTDEEVERVRELLPKIANGRKTRYQKLRDKQKPPAGVPVPHKKRKNKEKK